MPVHTRWLDVHSEDPTIIILRQPGTGGHDHAGEPDLVATTAVIEQMLNLVAANPTMPVKRAYDQVVAQAAVVHHIPPFNSVKSRLERRQARLMPPIPRRVADVAVQGEWAVSWGGMPSSASITGSMGF